MKEILGYLVILVISFAVIVYANKTVQGMCNSKGGQFVSIGIKPGCIYPTKITK